MVPNDLFHPYHGSFPFLHQPEVCEGIAGIIVYSKTHKSIKISRNQVKDLIDEAKPFEKFFALRKRKSETDQHPSFYVKQKKKKSIVNWLMGKD